MKISEEVWREGQIFFHGTTRRAEIKIFKEGLVVEAGRPTFSLSPPFALAYCRKSESYLRGLAARENGEELEREIEELVRNKVIERKELEETKYQWWINKANEYYKKTYQAWQEGILIGFEFTREEVEEPEESKLRIIEDKGKKMIIGAPSFWRTRQFCLIGKKGEKINLKNRKMIRIRVTKKLVGAIEGLAEAVKMGKMDEKIYKKFRQAVVDEIGKEIGEKMVEQTIESTKIRWLRTVLVAELKNKGFKIYWKKNDELIEDPRWDMSQEEIDQIITRLRSNLII